jgi:hypothetical protein
MPATTIPITTHMRTAIPTPSKKRRDAGSQITNPMIVTSTINSNALS